MGRTKASAVRQIAKRKGCSIRLPQCLKEGELEQVFGTPPLMPILSKLEPYKEQVAKWFRQGIHGKAIHAALEDVLRL